MIELIKIDCKCGMMIIRNISNNPIFSKYNHLCYDCLTESERKEILDSYKKGKK